MKAFSAQPLASAAVASLMALASLAAPSALMPNAAAQGASNPAGGAATEPALVVTLGSLNQLMQDVNYVTAMVGQPQAGGLFSMMAGGFAQGLDMDQPIGVLVPLVDGVPQPLAMLPTADIKSMLKRLEAQLGPSDELDDGTLVVSVGVNMLYIKQVGNWAALAQSRQTLELAPADPTTYFAGMGNEYFVAVRLQMQQVPQETRDVLVGQIRQGFDQAMRRGGGDEAGAQMAENAMAQLEQIINETDELMIGLDADQQSGQVRIDTSFTAVPGSLLADIYSGQQPIASRFSSVIRPDAAAYYHGAISISPSAAEQVKTQVESNLTMLSSALDQEDNLNPEQREKIELMVERVLALAVESIEEGKADTGALLMADESQGRFVLGSFVSDGNEAAQLVKDFAKEIENETDAPRFKFDIGTYNGVTMHLVEADVPADQDEARKVFGETLQIHIGTAPKAVYLGAGQDSESLLKSLIDAGDESSVPEGRPSGQFKLNLLPILEYAQSIEQNSTIATMIDALLKSSDTGQLGFVFNAIPNGQSSKIMLSEGLLKAIGAAVAEAQAARAPAGF